MVFKLDVVYKCPGMNIGGDKCQIAQKKFLKLKL